MLQLYLTSTPLPVGSCNVQLLHRACRQPNPRIVRLLIDHGACVRCADDSGKTPMHDLCWMGNVNKDSMLEIAHMLLSVVRRLGAAQPRRLLRPPQL